MFSLHHVGVLVGANGIEPLSFGYQPKALTLELHARKLVSPPIIEIGPSPLQGDVLTKNTRETIGGSLGI